MKIFLSVLAILIIFVAVLFVRGAMLKPPKTSSECDKKPEPDDDAVARFQKILQQKTIWNRDTSIIDYAPFDGFLEVLSDTYADAFKAASVDTVNKYGIIIKFKGNNSKLDPAIFMGHYDVVAADESEWNYPPFGAEIHGGTVYARGAVDTKCILCAVLEAVTRLLKDGFTPERDIYVITTNNEEIGGDTTPAMVEWFKERNIKPYIVLDEGGAITDSLPLGVTTPFAMIGLSEKGSADIKVSVSCNGGHSSTPSPNDACIQLVKALNNIEENPHKASISPVVRTMFLDLARHSSFLYKVIFGNLWLFSPLVIKIMKGNSMTNAMLATTDALTMLNGSEQINILPTHASAGFSTRVIPGETVDEAVDHVRNVCKNDNVKVESVYSFEPSPVSDYYSEQCETIKDVVRKIYTNADITPYVMNGGTDSKHFAKDCNAVYRFAGFEFSGEERKGIHGINEGLRVEKYLKGIDFYKELIKRM